jgi:hypothetical protein
VLLVENALMHIPGVVRVHHEPRPRRRPALALLHILGSTADSFMNESLASKERSNGKDPQIPAKLLPLLEIVAFKELCRSANKINTGTDDDFDDPLHQKMKISSPRNKDL